MRFQEEAASGDTQRIMHIYEIGCVFSDAYWACQPVGRLRHSTNHLDI